MIRWLRRVLPRWHNTEREIDEELNFHLEQRIEELVARGSSAAEARRRAEREFGDLGAARVELTRIDRASARRYERVAWFADLRGDLRFGLRMLARTPGFSVLLIVTLALTIGANTAAFSLFREVLLRRLPFQAPDRLVHLWEQTPAVSGRQSEASWPDYFDWKNQTRVFAGIEGYDPTNITISLPDGARMLQGARVTGGFLDLLGVPPLLGRSFQPQDEVAGGAQVAIVSYAFWQSSLGGNAAILDSTITVNGRSVRLVGVLPPGFRFTAVGDALLWLPYDPADPSREQRFNHQLRVVGRLKEGETTDGAQRDLDRVMRDIAETHPETNQGRTGMVIPLDEQLNGAARPVLLSLLGAMMLVLAVAVANIAGLLSARAVVRQEEMVVRTALGATRLRLLRQLLAESLVLAFVASLLGLMLAEVTLRWLSLALPDEIRNQLSLFQPTAVSGVALLYTALLTLLTGVGFGLGPVLHVAGSAPRLVAAGRRVSPGSRLNSLRNGFIAAEIALTMALLSGTLLVGRSTASLLQLDLGFEPRNVTSVRVALSGPRYVNQPQTQQQFFERVLEELRNLAGVQGAGAVSNLPLEGGGTLTLKVEGSADRPASQRDEVVSRSVAGDYFQTMQVPLLAGRFLTGSDDGSRTPVVLVDHTTARRLFGGDDPVGRQLRFYAFPDLAWTIAGVVGDVQTGALDGPFRPTVYFSHLQGAANRMSIVVRSSISSTELIRRIRGVVAGLDRDAAVYKERALESLVLESTPILVRRLSLTLVGLCAGMAVLLSFIGVYGMVAFSVAQRRRELGIRAALGATPGALLRNVMGQGLVLCATGTAAGLLLSVGIAQAARGLLLGVSPSDPVTYLVTGAGLAGVTLLASWWPARRAMRANPAAVLQQD